MKADIQLITAAVLSVGGLVLLFCGVFIAPQGEVQKDLPLIDKVPGRSGIRIHTGTIPEHSKGCVLVSARDKEKIIEYLTKNKQNNEETVICISSAY